MSDRPTREEIIAEYGEQWAEPILREREAADAMRAALDTVADGLEWYWHWGDGEGGYVLDELAQRVRAKGYTWPFDEKPVKAPAKQKISRSLSREVMERDEYRCVTCGTHKDLSCDHIIPESKGGPTTLDNLQTMCRPCNSRKGAKMPEGGDK